MARSAWIDGIQQSTRRRAGAGQHAEQRAGGGADAEADGDAGHRRRDVGLQFARGGKRAAVWNRRDGGGIRRPGARPVRTATSQAMPRAHRDDQRGAPGSAAQSPPPAGAGWGRGRGQRTAPSPRLPPARGRGDRSGDVVMPRRRARTTDRSACRSPPSHRHRPAARRPAATPCPASMMVCACFSPIAPLVRSLRSSCRATTASGSFIAATISAFSSAGCSTDHRRARS